MSTRSERKKRRARRSCPACGQYRARHYVGPSFGDPGFYICELLPPTPTEGAPHVR